MSKEENKAGLDRGQAQRSRRRSGKRSKVVSILEWHSSGGISASEEAAERMPAAGKGAPGDTAGGDAISPGSLGLNAREMPAMSVPQKKVALIYYILSGDITDQQLDRMVGVVATPV
jgi:hypothetical protein